MLECSLAGQCSGCPLIMTPYPEQLESKKKAFVGAWISSGLPEGPLSDLKFVSPGEGGLRERADLVLKNEEGEMRLGLYGKDYEILPFGECPQMTGPLQLWFNEVKKDLPAIKEGSLRLRVSPEGAKGIWIDFSNVEIKHLLEDGKWLNQLQEKAIVEIGQKRKRLGQKEKRWALIPPRLETWTHTYLNDKPFPLYSSIATFTQSGTLAIKSLVKEFRTLLPDAIEGSWLELGAGIGTFTFPLAYAGANVLATEMDPYAIEGLQKARLSFEGKERVDVRRLSFHPPSKEFLDLIPSLTGIVADPPRSGLGGFLSLLEQVPIANRPKYFLSVSCFAESFVKDSTALYSLGYKLDRLSLVDQFPQTPHCEIVARFQLA